MITSNSVLLRNTEEVIARFKKSQSVSEVVCTKISIVSISSLSAF